MKNYNKNWSLRLWLVKKLLSNKINKEEIYSIVSEFFDNHQEEEINSDNKKEINENNENELLKNILKLNDKTVEDVMVPRAEIIAIPNNQSIEEIFKIISNESHSRMPIYQDNLDNVIGMMHIKDILSQSDINNFSIKNIIRDILFVAPSSPVLDLLKRMRKSKIHLGLVIDEHGGVDGLVTIEDLVEEIVGEIEDEHDAEDYELKIRKIDTHSYLLNASVSLIELENLLNISFDKNEKEEIDTVGGLLFFISGRIPSTGETFKHKTGVIFEVLEASERTINKIKVTYKIL